MINSVALTGRVTKDLELKYSQSGTAILNCNLAVDRAFQNKSGERDTDFINCVAFKKTAETMANHLRKGSLIGIEGRIQTRNYENNQGQRVYVTEVIVDKFTFLESKKQAESNNHTYGQNNQATQQPVGIFAQSGDPIDISDDDLPF